MKRTKKNLKLAPKTKQQKLQDKEEEEITSESSEEEEIVEENKKRKIEEEEKNESNGLNSDELRAQLARAYLEKLDAIHRQEDESSSDDDRIGVHLEREAVFSFYDLGVPNFHNHLFIYS